MQPSPNSLRRLVGARILLPVAVMTTLGVSVSAAQEPLTIRAAIETTRPMTDRNGNAIFVSPNGRRYVIVLITGDVERDGVWAELRVGRLDTLLNAAPVSVARFFTHARGGGYLRHGGSEALLAPRRNAPRWIDDDHVALLWDDERTLRQVLSINANTGELRYLTHHPSDVLHFSVIADGTLLYGARVPCTPRPSPQEQARGYVVTSDDAFGLFYGCSAGARDQQALFVTSQRHPVARQIAMQGGDAVNRSQPWFPAALFSPSGDQAVFPNTVSDIPQEWQAYTAEHFRAMWNSRHGGVHDPYGSQFQLPFVIDIANATAKPLWRAPNDVQLRMAWSPDSRTLLIGPTFLPSASADAAGLAGAAVAEVDVRSGRFRQLPVPPEAARRIRELRWVSSRDVELRLDAGCLRYRRGASRWSAVSLPAASECAGSSNERSAIRIELEQDLNLPPRLVAVEQATGKRHVVLDPNAGLATRYSLGDVRWLERDVGGGYRWEGRLYYPVDYQAGQRYPLVVHTHSFAGRNEFSLYSRGGSSPTLGPGMSAYIAQPLASRGFFVLHGRATDGRPPSDLVDQVKVRVAATEAIIHELVREGLVDSARVGLMGYSASGWEVSYAIAHPTFPYAAALTDDNKEGSYLEAAFTNWLFGTGEEMIGAPPFSEGLKAWLAESPAFNAHRVTTPLLISVTTPGVELLKWEFFSRLRFLRRPVELYFVPDLPHGSHGLQNPTQVLTLQQRALDWWCFWLRDEEDDSPAKADQYAGWRVLREQRGRLLESTAGRNE